MLKNTAIGLCLFALLCLHTGCQTMGSSSRRAPSSTATDPDGAGPSTLGRAGLVPQARPPIPDIPVPIGMKMIEDISRNYESADARFVDHTYQGREERADVARFYRTHMPVNGWTTRGSRMVRGTYVLMFEKDSEFAEVRIESDSTLTGQRTSVNVSVQTLGRGEPEVYRNQAGNG